MCGGSWDSFNTGLWAGDLWKQDASGRLLYSLCLGNNAQTDVSEVVGNEELPAGSPTFAVSEHTPHHHQKKAPAQSWAYPQRCSPATVRLSLGPTHCLVLPGSC